MKARLILLAALSGCAAARQPPAEPTVYPRPEVPATCWVAAPGCRAPYPFCGEPNLDCGKPRPTCPAGSVPTLVDRCWGACVAVGDCRCAIDGECRAALPGTRCVEGRCRAGAGGVP